LRLIESFCVSTLSLFLFSIANAQNLQYQFNHLSEAQIQVLKKSCQFGIKDNLCYSLSAIAWQESNLGVWIVNFQDKGGGWFGVKVSSAIRRLVPKMRMTKFNINRVGSWLINNPSFSAKLAIAELKYWLRYWHGNYYKAWGSYNGGYRWNRRYARAIAKKVRFLKKHLIY